MNRRPPQQRTTEPGPTEPPPHRPGQTTTNVAGDPAPRLPHEHDESSSSQAAEAVPEVMRQAHQDVSRGLRDTSRGEASDETYNRTLREDAPPPRRKPTSASGG